MSAHFREAWRAVATAKIEEFCFQCERLADLAHEGLVNRAEAADVLTDIASAQLVRRYVRREFHHHHHRGRIPGTGRRTERGSRMSWEPTQSIWNEAERKAQERLRKEFGQYLQDKGAAESTVDALMYSLRHGLSALEPSDQMQRDTLRRLSELSKGQLIDDPNSCCTLLTKRNPPWTKDELTKLVLVWKAVRK